MWIRRMDKMLPLISKETYKVIKEHAAALDEAIIYDRDFSYDYFGFKTLERSYLMKIDNKVVERPQHLLMRVAVGIHGSDIPLQSKLTICCRKNGLRMQLLRCSMPEHRNHNCRHASC